MEHFRLFVGGLGCPRESRRLFPPKKRQEWHQPDIPAFLADAEDGQGVARLEDAPICDRAPIHDQFRLRFHHLALLVPGDVGDDVLLIQLGVRAGRRAVPDRRSGHDLAREAQGVGVPLRLRAQVDEHVLPERDRGRRLGRLLRRHRTYGLRQLRHLLFLHHVLGNRSLEYRRQASSWKTP